MKSLLNLLIVLAFSQSISFAQNFEGRMIYKLTIERPENSQIPLETFKSIFKAENSTINYYFNGNKCKTETNDADKKKLKTISIYDFDSGKIYSYMSGQNEICYFTNLGSNSIDSSIIKFNNQDTLSINNELCHSINISDENNRAKYYYPIKSQLNLEDFIQSNSEVLGFITKKEIFPFRIILSGNGAIHNIVLTLDSIIKEPVNSEIFKLPEFKKIMNPQEIVPTKKKTIIKTEIDTLLVGSWKGSEKNKERIGLEKHWIQDRLSDGTYTTHFTEIENNEETKYTTKGNWWVENGVFYELGSSNFEPYTYRYEILNESQVHFKAINLEYEFIDTKIE